MVSDRQRHLEAAYEELLQLAADRRARLEESRKLWQFYWDMADEEGWVKEKEQLMSSPDLGHGPHQRAPAAQQTQGTGCRICLVFNKSMLLDVRLISL